MNKNERSIGWDKKGAHIYWLIIGIISLTSIILKYSMIAIVKI